MSSALDYPCTDTHLVCTDKSAFPVFRQNCVDKVRDGCFAVCARNANQFQLFRRVSGKVCRYRRVRDFRVLNAHIGQDLSQSMSQTMQTAPASSAAQILSGEAPTQCP